MGKSRRRLRRRPDRLRADAANPATAPSADPYFGTFATLCTAASALPDSLATPELLGAFLAASAALIQKGETDLAVAGLITTFAEELAAALPAELSAESLDLVAEARGQVNKAVKEALPALDGFRDLYHQIKADWEATGHDAA